MLFWMVDLFLPVFWEQTRSSCSEPGTENPNALISCLLCVYVRVCVGVCVCTQVTIRGKAVVSVCLWGRNKNVHTHTNSSRLMYWAVMSPWFDVKSGLNFHPLPLVSIIAISSICAREYVLEFGWQCCAICVSVIFVCLFLIVGVEWGQWGGGDEELTGAWQRKNTSEGVRRLLWAHKSFWSSLCGHVDIPSYRCGQISVAILCLLM